MTRAKFFGAAFLCLAGCFPNDSFACGVKCVCNQPSTKQVTCVNANPTCDDSITVRVTSTSYNQLHKLYTGNGSMLQDTGEHTRRWQSRQTLRRKHGAVQCPFVEGSTVG